MLFFNVKPPQEMYISGYFLRKKLRGQEIGVWRGLVSLHDPFALLNFVYVG